METTLTNVWNRIKFGDILLVQKYSDKKFSKPFLVCIIGVEVWDMACAVHYVDYKNFNPRIEDGDMSIETESFGEWMEYWNILGHWNTMPDFKTLLNAYKTQSEERKLIAGK